MPFNENSYQLIEINEKGYYRLVPSDELKRLILLASMASGPNTTQLGATIRNYRQKLGMKQKELAAKMKITPASMNRLEKDIFHPDPVNMQKLYLLFGEEFEREVAQLILK